MTAALEHGITGRVHLELTPTQARAWAEKLFAQALSDPERRSPRFWGTYLGLSGPNLDRVLAELGEAPAPLGVYPVLQPRRAYYVRQLLREDFVW